MPSASLSSPVAWPPFFYRCQINLRQRKTFFRFAKKAFSQGKGFLESRLRDHRSFFSTTFSHRHRGAPVSLEMCSSRKLVNLLTKSLFESVPDWSYLTVSFVQLASVSLGNNWMSTTGSVAFLASGVVAIIASRIGSVLW